MILRKTRSSFWFLCALLVLGACGFHPLYAPSPTSSNLSAVALETIQEKEGQALHLLLADRFYGVHAAASPSQWSLTVALTSAKQNLGIRRDDTATRARLLLKADVMLRRANSRADEPPVYAGTERSFVGYNILSDPYATLSAEENAMNRGLSQLADAITRRVAVSLSQAPAPSSSFRLPAQSPAVSSHETQVR